MLIISFLDLKTPMHRRFRCMLLLLLPILITWTASGARVIRFCFLLLVMNTITTQSSAHSDSSTHQQVNSNTNMDNVWDFLNNVDHHTHQYHHHNHSNHHQHDLLIDSLNLTSDLGMLSDDHHHNNHHHHHHHDFSDLINTETNLLASSDNHNQHIHLNNTNTNNHQNLLNNKTETLNSMVNDLLTSPSTSTSSSLSSNSSTSNNNNNNNGNNQHQQHNCNNATNQMITTNTTITTVQGKTGCNNSLLTPSPSSCSSSSSSSSSPMSSSSQVTAAANFVQPTLVIANQSDQLVVSTQSVGGDQSQMQTDLNKQASVTNKKRKRVMQLNIYMTYYNHIR